MRYILKSKVNVPHQYPRMGNFLAKTEAIGYTFSINNSYKNSIVSVC